MDFLKIRIEYVMLKFLATTENIKKIRSVESNYNRGKVVKNCYSQFLIHNSNESRAVLIETEGRGIVGKEEIYKKLDRVNLRWRGGQPNSPNGPEPKLVP